MQHVHWRRLAPTVGRKAPGGEMQNLFVGQKLHRFFLLFLSLSIFRPQILFARTLAPLTRTTLEAVPTHKPVPGPAPVDIPSPYRDLMREAEAIDPATLAPVAAPAAAAPASAPVEGESLSIGEPNRGRLANGLALTTDSTMLVRSDENFGTRETVELVRKAVARVHEQFPEGHRIVVGDLSKEHGGRIRPHRSHQNGRDIDLGYYLLGEAPPNMFVPVTPKNFDLERNWALIEALIEGGGVQYVFIDRRVQKLLRDYAETVKKVPEARLARIFEFPRRGSLSTLVRHRRGHKNHLHVRFHSPLAVAAAERAEKTGELVAKAEPAAGARDQLVRSIYKVRKGDTLARIAQRYKVGIGDLLRWNRIKARTKLQLGQGIAIVKRVRVAVEAPNQSVCHAGPRAVGCWHPSRT